jgi:hypothetical protein
MRTAAKRRTCPKAAERSRTVSISLAMPCLLQSSRKAIDGPPGNTHIDPETLDQLWKEMDVLVHIGLQSCSLAWPKTI